MFDSDYYNELYRTIGMIIRKKRLIHYSNMEQFARDIGMKVQQYSKYEMGKNMKVKTMHRILNHLNVSFSEFYAEVEMHMKKYNAKSINNN